MLLLLAIIKQYYYAKGRRFRCRSSWKNSLKIIETIQQVQQWAELIGPNAYLQAFAIALVFIVIGKIADWIFKSVYNDRALVMALAPTKHSGANRECHEMRRGNVRNAVEKVINEGRTHDRFRELDSALISEFFLGAVSGMIDSMSFQGKFLKPNDVVPTLMQLVLGGIEKRADP